MSLYFAYTPDIDSRRVDYIFFFENNGCFLSSNNKSPSILFELESFDLNTYKQIIVFAEEHRLSSYEIMLSNEAPLEEILKFLSTYLSDKDLSIGLLTNDRNINNSLLDRYGVTSSYPRVIKNKHNDYYYDELECLGAPPSPNGHPDFAIGSVLDLGSPAPKKKSKKNRIDKIYGIELDESFHDKFVKLLIESGKDNVEVYKKAGITRQVFSKILSDENMIPTKLTLISLCIGLELPLKVAKELMISAGYSLSRSIIMDMIVMKYLREEIYDLDLINSELNEYGCPLLGWHPRDN